ncbi:aminotransferase DegT [Kaistia sp. 32K]|uniref:DegT/DnrJ/EryC1/StrS family aminotransferase n=1 Tax=Kaistia sp. 32K TaxID=2795690 RepID=UPI001915B97E|nr:DegT/DnrJ/EryC1/StrS family aminotransferase [Kaistia sp. 32K]BCP51553.1 aminotransferase DegT [Kaistia sp. 32K]
MTAWPRFKMYGVPTIFRQAVSDFAGGRVQSGDDVAALERALSDLTGAAHAIAVPQARVGIHLVLKSLIERSGKQKVVLSPYTIYDVVNMVVSAGGIPVFADIEPNNANLDPDAVAPLLDDGVAAVLVTHLHGLVCDLERLGSLCRKRGIPLVEDAAQAFGGHWEGRALGTVGIAGVFSFGRAKNVNCFFGGAVVTDDGELARALRDEVRDYAAMDPAKLAKRVLSCLGYSVAVSRALFPLITHPLYRWLTLRHPKRGAELLSTERSPVLRSSLPEASRRKLSPMQARCALGQFPALAEQQRKRGKLAEIYRSGLANLPSLRLPIELPGTDNVYLAYPIQVSDRVALQQFMVRQGRDVVIQHIGNCADYDCFAEYRRSCPVARDVAASVLLLPTYPDYPPSEARANVEAIRAFLEVHSQ